jgi:hypothetical protein
MDMKVSLESLYLKHFERVGISIIYANLNNEVIVIEIWEIRRKYTALLSDELYDPIVVIFPPAPRVNKTHGKRLSAPFQK